MTNKLNSAESGNNSLSLYSIINGLTDDQHELLTAKVTNLFKDLDLYHSNGGYFKNIQHWDCNTTKTHTDIDTFKSIIEEDILPQDKDRYVGYETHIENETFRPQYLFLLQKIFEKESEGSDSASIHCIMQNQSSYGLFFSNELVIRSIIAFLKNGSNRKLNLILLNPSEDIHDKRFFDEIKAGGHERKVNFYPLFDKNLQKQNSYNIRGVFGSLSEKITWSDGTVFKFIKKNSNNEFKQKLISSFTELYSMYKDARYDPSYENFQKIECNKNAFVTLSDVKTSIDDVKTSIDNMIRSNINTQIIMTDDPQKKKQLEKQLEDELKKMNS